MDARRPAVLWIDWFYIFQFAAVSASLAESALVHVFIRFGKESLALRIDLGEPAATRTRTHGSGPIQACATLCIDSLMWRFSLFQPTHPSAGVLKSSTRYPRTARSL